MEILKPHQVTRVVRIRPNLSHNGNLTFRFVHSAAYGIEPVFGIGVRYHQLLEILFVLYWIPTGVGYSS